MEQDILYLQDVYNKLSNFDNKCRINEIINHIQNKENDLYNWNEYICKSHKQMMLQRNSKEIGKIRAYATELIICDFLNKHAIRHDSEYMFIHNDDIEQVADILHSLEVDVQQVCQSGYDILAVNPSNGSFKRIQVKHRNSNIHLETTRRNSIKNKGKNQSGHIAYSSDEFDFLIVVKGNFENDINIRNNIVIFPSNVLNDVNNNNILVKSVSKKIEAMYKNLTEQMLHDVLF